MTSSTPTTSESNKDFIVLVHGGASSSRMYKDVIPLLSPKFNIVSPDLPGHGTAASEGPFTFPAAVKTVKKSIDDIVSSQHGATSKIMVVGISLGGQVVLSFLKTYPNLVNAAIVSGASIHPPDDKVSWEMPHMPSDKDWVNLMMEDVALAGFQNMPALQEKSLAFTFEPPEGDLKDRFPAVLVMIGENDMAMAKRDFDELSESCKRLNEKSEGSVMKGAWHNHSIDVPDKFAEAVKAWAAQVL